MFRVGAPKRTARLRWRLKLSGWAEEVLEHAAADG